LKLCLFLVHDTVSAYKKVFEIGPMGAWLRAHGVAKPASAPANR
jgi:hypothetical protein